MIYANPISVTLAPFIDAEMMQNLSFAMIQFSWYTLIRQVFTLAPSIDAEMMQNLSCAMINFHDIR